MSVMSDLDILHRDGAVTQNDFIERGISPERAEAYARIVADRTDCNIECHCEDHDYGNDPDGKAFANPDVHIRTRADLFAALGYVGDEIRSKKLAQDATKDSFIRKLFGLS